LNEEVEVIGMDEEPVCEVPAFEPTDEEIEGILNGMKIIAIVGISDKTDRDSYRVARYLQSRGFRIVPVNPSLTEVLWKKAYPDLKAIPRELFPIDVVDIFRKSDAVQDIVRDAIAIGAKAVWMQEGIVNNAAAETARAAGLKVVMNRCIMKTYRANLETKKDREDL
jgi:hypothetical protein